VRLALLVLVSTALHVVAAWGLGREAAGVKRRHETVELVVAPPRRVEPPPPTPVAEAARVQQPAPTSASRRAHLAPRVLVAAAPGDSVAVAAPPPLPAPRTDDPLDFTSAAPIAAPAAAAAKVASGPPPPRPVPLASLSRPPSPPPLDDTLRAHYPAAARAAGRAGRAAVRVRIDADGVASVLSVLDASEPGFAEACRATVQRSRWRPPLDAQGAAVATEVTYTCAFEVGAW
jgi:TonB family protein